MSWHLNIPDRVVRRPSPMDADPARVAERVAADVRDAERVPAIRRRAEREIAEWDMLASLRKASCQAWCDRTRGAQ
jgi:hypothetical protein